MHVLVLYHRCLNMLLCVFGDVQGVTLSAGANTCLGALPQVSVHAAVCVWGCAHTLAEQEGVKEQAQRQLELQKFSTRNAGMLIPPLRFKSNAKEVGACIKQLRDGVLNGTVPLITLLAYISYLALRGDCNIF